MADINARIYWQPGMELTANTFKELAANLYTKQKIANCIANNNRIGLLPEAEFDCGGRFVKNVLEIPHFRCRALLPSGRIIDADEDVTVKIPILYGDTYYLTVGFGEEDVTFEKREVTFVRHRYVYGIHTLEEVQKGDLMPVLKFSVTEGRFSIDAAYIPPCLLVGSDSRLSEAATRVADALEAISRHEHLEEGEGKRCVLHYTFLLRAYDSHNSTQDFMQLLLETAHAVDYHLARPNTGAAPDIPRPDAFDVAEWLKWLDGYLAGIVTILDGVVLEDHTIDYEKLKEELRAEIYDKVYAELYERIRKEILERFNPDMERVLRETLTAYIDGELRARLSASLTEELSASLHDRLYPQLYESLYNALYVPVQEEEEEEYIPQI